MNKTENASTSSYRQIFKATSLFGGVQVVNILIAVTRSKFVAVLLGTSGVGIMGLLLSTTGLISSITGLGLGFSAVRDISEAHSTGNTKIISRVIISFRRWVWFTGLFGAGVTLILSKQLSIWTFGNTDYSLAFIWLSCTLLMGALSSGQNALLQGVRRLKDMATASILGSILGLLISIPLYYQYGIEGIVPTIVISAAFTLLLDWYFARKIVVEKIHVPLQSSIEDGLGMAKLGILMTISGFIGMLVAYVTNAFISRTGGVEDVGLYQAGWGIANKYVGLVFTAMATDYFPRLAAVNTDHVKVNNVVNQQADITIFILAPVLILLLSTTPILIQLLFTSEFLPVVPFIQWVALGMLFKAASWCLGFIVLAKADSKLFFLTELSANGIVLACNLFGYYLFGLEGLGISFVVSYALYLLMMMLVCYKKYSFQFTSGFIKVSIVQGVMCLAAFLIAYVAGFPWAYLSGSILMIASSWYSWKELDKRIDISTYIKSKFFKKANM